MPYILDICDKYPSLVQSVIWADKDTGYNPITLSGVVDDEAALLSDADKKRISIELPAIFTFHMPFCTKVENRPTTFSVAIVKILLLTF